MKIFLKTAAWFTSVVFFAPVEQSVERLHACGLHVPEAFAEVCTLTSMSATRKLALLGRFDFEIYALRYVPVGGSK